MRVLCLKVKDPQSVIEMMQTKSQKYVLQSNYNLYGTPAFITDISIDIPIEDLQLEVENRLYERRKAQEANVAERLPDVPDAEPLRVALGNR